MRKIFKDGIRMQGPPTKAYEKNKKNLGNTSAYQNSKMMLRKTSTTCEKIKDGINM